MKKYYFIPAIVGFCFLTSFLSLRYIHNPYIWVFLSWGIMFALGAVCRLNFKIKILLINIAVVFFTLSAFETYLGIGGKEPTIITATKGLNKSDDVLGYRRAKNFQAKAKKIHKSEVIYDVTYTTDSNGLRISPPFKKRKNQPCILFFGGSFTFGTGVNDEEAMPYRVGVRTGEKFQIYNFGVGGYGPHQMLAAIEHGFVDKAIQCSPKHIFYLAIWPHLRRVTGRLQERRYGPQYIVDKQGNAIYSGNFESDKSFRGLFTQLFQKSRIYSKIFSNVKAYSKEDKLLFHAIVRKSRDLLKSHYPQALFQILYWGHKHRPDGKEDIHEELVEGFKQDQIPVHLISNILPGLEDNAAIYRIRPPYEIHPNALAHDKIAQYIAEKILMDSLP